MRTDPPRLLAVALALLSSLQLGVARAPEELQPFEFGAAMVQLGRVRMLAQRISKQNLLVQLNLAEGARAEMTDTALELDATLETLREGGILMAVPEPPTIEASQQLARVDAAWSALRAMALASPYDYARRSGTRRDRDDPLLIRYFDALSSAIDEDALAAVRIYTDICVKTGKPSIVGTSAEQICTLMATATETGMLSERMSKEVCFALAGVDAEANRASLERTRASFSRALNTALKSTLIEAAMSPERGVEGRVVSGIAQGIQDAWGSLRQDVDHVIEGRPEEVDLERSLETQRELLWGVQRLSVAVERFAAQRRAERRRAEVHAQ